VKIVRLAVENVKRVGDGAEVSVVIEDGKVREAEEVAV
jgi:hypothetical protein